MSVSLVQKARDLIISLQAPQLHPQLEAQECRCANGLEFQQSAQCLQLLMSQIIQSQRVLKQLGVLQDLLIGRLSSCAADLREFCNNCEKYILQKLLQNQLPLQL